MNRTKTLIRSAFAAFILIGTGCGKTSEYTISGQFADTVWNNGYVYLAQQAGREWQFLDSAKVSNKGSFKLNGMQDTAVFRTLIVKNSLQQNVVTPLIVEPGNINVSIGKNIFLKGTNGNKTLQQFLNIENSCVEQLSNIIKKWKNETDELKKQILVTNYNNIESAYIDSAKTFIASNQGNAAGAYAFLQIYHQLTDAEQTAILAETNELFRLQPGISRIIERLETLKNVAVGKPFVDLEMESTTGSHIKLSEFAGKGTYVVVDFWASWCGPCRRAMPELKKIYALYHPKGLEIVGISLDKNREDWLSGIKNLDLPWPQISDLKGWESSANSVYGVNSIPHLMLLDKDGTILAKNLDDKSLLEKLQEVIH